MSFWTKLVESIPIVGPVVGAVVGADKASKSVDKATDTSLQQAQMLDQREREAFEEAKRQADILRQRGDEAAAVALEEGIRAEVGADKFEALSNQYAQQFANSASQFNNYANQVGATGNRVASYGEQIGNTAGQFNNYSNSLLDYGRRADEAAANREAVAYSAYNKVNRAADARQQAGQTAQRDILSAAQRVQDSAAGFDQRLSGANQQGQALFEGANDRGQQMLGDANQRGQILLQGAGNFGDQALTDTMANISARYAPFIQSEARSRGQLDVEMGLTPGEANKTYRDSPAYAAMMEAARVAEQEGIDTINQSAGNNGVLYSGSRGAALVDRAKQGSYERAAVEQNYFQNYMGMLERMAAPTSTNALSSFEADNAAQRTGLAERTAGQRVGLDSSITGQRVGLDNQTAAQRAAMGMDAAGAIGSNYMSAANTGLNAQTAASQMGLNSMRTGAEGLELMAYLDPRTAGADYVNAAGAMTGNAANAYSNAAGAYGSAGNLYGGAADIYGAGVNAMGTGANYALSGLDRGTAGSPYRMQAQDYRLNAAGNAAGVITGNMPTGVNSAGLITNAANNAAQAKNAMIGDLAGAGANLYSAYLMSQQPRQAQQPAVYTSSPYMTPGMRYA